MKLKILKILIIIFTTVSGFGQNNYHFGLKGGFSISKFPRKYKEIDNFSYPTTYEYTRIENPLISPVIGLDIFSPLNSNFSLLFGVEYQMTGTKFSGTNTSSSSSGINSFNENKTLHKVCIPAAVGYSIKIKNNESLIHLGLRPGFLITGKYYHKWENNIGPNYVFITRYNPFKPESDYITPLKRFVVQFSIIISNNISEHVKANLSFNFGKSQKSYYHEYKNTDFNLSITYLFNKSSL